MALIEENIDFAIALQPFDGDTVCGDFGLVRIFDQKVFIAAVDVAGHGEQAAALAEEMKRFLEKNYRLELLELIKSFHDHFKGSRGCAGGLGIFDLKKKKLNYIAVGNINARIFGEKPRRFIYRSGVIGYLLPTLRKETSTLVESDTLILYSDGIKEHFELDASFNLAASNASDVADKIMRDFSKSSDDSLCMVIKFLK